MASKHTILRFLLRQPKGRPFDVFTRFHPEGKTLLNRTEWRGKEPRSCGVTKVSSRSYTAQSEQVVWEIEVSYRPKGTITFVGNTRYDGWTAMVLDRKKDGTLLDGAGNPLPPGAQPVYLPVEVFGDTEFNEIDFGEFVGESEVGGIKHTSVSDALHQLEHSMHVTGSMGSGFMAPRRTRPTVKVILSNAPSATARDGFGTRIINVNNFTPHLQQVIADHLTELMGGFLEGRYSVKNMSTSEMVFVVLSDSLVDCTPNEQGKESRFNCLHEYVPATFLEDLAQQLMATYEVDATVVDGPEGGLILRHLPKKFAGEG